MSERERDKMRLCVLFVPPLVVLLHVFSTNNLVPRDLVVEASSVMLNVGEFGCAQAKCGDNAQCSPQGQCVLKECTAWNSLGYCACASNRDCMDNKQCTKAVTWVQTLGVIVGANRMGTCDLCTHASSGFTVQDDPFVMHNWETANGLVLENTQDFHNLTLVLFVESRKSLKELQLHHYTKQLKANEIWVIRVNYEEVGYPSYEDYESDVAEMRQFERYF